MSKRANGEGSVRLRGKIWWLLYRVDGKQLAKSTKGMFDGVFNDGTSKEVALQMLRAELTDTSRGAIPAAISGQLRYEDIKESYLTKKPEQRGYYGLQHIDNFFGGKSVTSITTDTIEEFIEHRREEDEVSDPTIRRNLVVLRAMFNLAKKSKKLGLRDIPYFPMPDDSDPAGQYIEPQEFAKVLTHLPENLQPFFKFMYSTGCRLGAAQKITWDMISKDCTKISLPGSIVKTRQPLALFLVGKQLEPVAAMFRKTFRDPSKPVFDSTNYRPAWSKACAKSGLGTYDKKTRTRTGVRIHDCRCSAAINLLAAGVDEGLVLKIGGWKTRAMLDRYNVQHDERIKTAMEKGGAYVSAAQANG